MSDVSHHPELPPMDEHNRRLIENVHPPDWKNPTPNGRYNLVVIGAGTAGLVAASAAAQMGAKVALIERHLLGGDCLNVGCVPSKGIIAPANAAAKARYASDLGIDVKSVQPDFSKAMERMRRIRAKISQNDSATRFRDLGVDVYLGGGKFIDGSTVGVAAQQLKFSKAVIATGARAAAPPIEGLDSVDYLTNETVFSLTVLPQRFGIIGAGPIGCELAQAFARMGSEVFLIESADRILTKEDEKASRILHDSLVRDGVNILRGGKKLNVSRNDDRIQLTGESMDMEYDLLVDKILVAVGRAPNVEHLDLEAAGVAYNKRGVEVNDRLQTTNPKIYAAGDVCSRYQFTHAADFMARTVLRNSLFLGRGEFSKLTIPWCTYTSPEVAHVGLYEHEAKDQKIEFDSYIQEFSDVDRAMLEGEVEGFVQVLTKKGGDKILGATIVAANAGDMISQITMAMTHGLGLGKIASTIFPYPTQAEAIRQVGDKYNRTRMTPLVKWLFNKWLAFCR